uniref:Reverse transcriptase domain-containing protein n=1 Tax=Megaselia scalaris TaxID=36166 RepID=T1GZ36_MEGSC
MMRNQARNSISGKITPIGSACKDINGNGRSFSVNCLMAISKTSKNRFHFVSQNNGEMPPPSRTKVNRAIQRLKKKKSAGSDGILPAKLLKAAGATFNDVFHIKLSSIWISEKMSEEWNVSIIYPVHKKDKQ